MFAFTYDELKAYRDDVFQHTIPLRPDSKPFRQKLKRINPKLAQMVQQELHKNVSSRHHCSNKTFIMVLKLVCC